ncbi:hypothetical protein [Sphingomonas sp.]|uniref:hypothetical protein n=1 Tax=Sphingomonas sp. TaxID=28214 RepID=UPI003342B0B7
MPIPSGGGVDMLHRTGGLQRSGVLLRRMRPPARMRWHCHKGEGGDRNETDHDDKSFEDERTI